MPRLEATFSAFKRPPGINGFEAPDKGPHLIRDEHFCKILLRLKSFNIYFYLMHIPAIIDCPPIIGDPEGPIPTDVVDTKFPVEAYL